MSFKKGQSSSMEQLKRCLLMLSSLTGLFITVNLLENSSHVIENCGILSTVDYANQILN